MERTRASPGWEQWACQTEPRVRSDYWAWSFAVDDLELPDRSAELPRAAEFDL
jgi:hypothetical protein